MSKLSIAKQQANHKWDSNNLDRISIALKKGQKDIIKNAALKNNESINAFVNRAIENLLNDEKG